MTPTVQLHQGDCLDILRTLADGSVDAVVTDPPAGIEFMGKAWDSPWQEGFTKHGFSDGAKRKGAPTQRLSTRNPMCKKCHKHIRGTGGCCCAESQPDEDPAFVHRVRVKQRAAFVGRMTDIFAECLRVLKPGGHVLVWALPRTSHWTATAVEDAGFEIRDVVMHIFGSGFPKSLNVSKAIDKAAGAKRKVVGTYVARGFADVSPTSDGRNQWAAGEVSDKVGTRTAPATDAARQWDGWGTALKPGAEHWILARKPLIGTVAKNILEHGTGGINIDGCRIAAIGRPARIADKAGESQNAYGDGLNGSRAIGTTDTGRWPANVTTDGSDEVTSLFPQANSCNTPSQAKPSSKFRPTQGNYQPQGRIYPGDTGSAARFFYCAKASKSDRDEGNTHPTVKPNRLMRYLCRLITPPEGTILDPFTGSGSTGKAAVQEGFGFIGIEKEAEYFAIAQRRIAAAQSARAELLIA